MTMPTLPTLPKPPVAQSRNDHAATPLYKRVAASSSSLCPANTTDSANDGGVVAGAEHFSLWLREPGTPAPRFVTASIDNSWPEFIAGYHHDIRQKSRLRALCSAAGGG
jgi:hypothetical protein